ncbi:radical SAM domain-containing protein [Neoasaia chiangmaiensis NBRC 101099]|uniref:Radical SAM protein n=1 Tax=Neoasaia chiangmaiensis TaxID=320497 RepID=A0A1U9KS54_9PROT|nr:spore photoproduct lyase family protein [Neoasaia chiangmaiensis]AQS88671.1 radical SAM protein [Neoasaia chiangmaiensis]GBR41094.1 radical SAM domain-containing protein [Neoasaia chiangmaiensis NBRC 101099]GEN13614.1 spore photoproduct lyase family protein [Neoasaia chiangmaiensis]
MDALFDIRQIYLEEAVRDYARGQEILARHPNAQLIPVDNHWRIPQFFGNEGAAEEWLRIKRETLILGVRKTLTMRPNGRSADFIAPSSSNGCGMACAYCYVPRRKGYANPVTVLVNIDDITRAIIRHAGKLGWKTAPNQIDPAAWVYDLGENGDLSADALLSDNVRDLIGIFRDLPNAKGSFATKRVNRALLDYDPRGRTRVRVSLMPPEMARRLDIRTDPIDVRIAFIDELVRAGYEVHVNFSPVVVHENWQAEWRSLLHQLNDGIGAAAKAQLKAEIIMLTHNAALHEVNMRWHPRGEDWLWRPDLQENKKSEGGMINLRYRHRWKGRWLGQLRDWMAEIIPYCAIRYAF